MRWDQNKRKLKEARNLQNFSNLKSCPKSMNFYCRVKGRGPSHSQNIKNSHSVAIHLTFKIHRGDRNNTKGFRVTESIPKDLGVFESMLIVAFQSAFHSKMHENFFLFIFNIFYISISKRSKNNNKKKLSKNNQFF